MFRKLLTNPIKYLLAQFQYLPVEPNVAKSYSLIVKVVNTAGYLRIIQYFLQFILGKTHHQKCVRPHIVCKLLITSQPSP
jgi:hypothetical protein